MFITSFDDGYSPVLSEFETYGNAERSDSNDAICGRLLVAELTFWSVFSFSFLTGHLLMA